MKPLKVKILKHRDVMREHWESFTDEALRALSNKFTPSKSSTKLPANVRSVSQAVVTRDQIGPAINTLIEQVNDLARKGHILGSYGSLDVLETDQECFVCSQLVVLTEEGLKEFDNSQV